MHSVSCLYRMNSFRSINALPTKSRRSYTPSFLAIRTAVRSILRPERAYELGLRAGYEAGPRNHALSGPYRLALVPTVEEQIREEITALLEKLK